MSTNSAILYPPSPTPPVVPLSTPPPTNNNELEYIPPNGFLWTEQRVRALALLADGRYSNREIAQIIGTKPNTLSQWKSNPIFAQKLNDSIEEYRNQVLSTTIAVKINRIAALQRRHRLLESIVLQRSEQIDPSSPFYNPEFLTVPGLSSGFILPSLSSIKTSPHRYETFLEGKLDTALLNEFRAIEKQAAEETGQWSETHNINILQKAYIGIDIAQV